MVGLALKKSSTLKFQNFMDFGGQDADPGPAVGVQNSHGSGGGGWFKSWDFGHVFLVLRPGYSANERTRLIGLF